MSKVQVFNLKSMSVQPYEHREKNVFFQAKEFKTRLIELPPEGEMPPCEMRTYVVFYALAGSAEIWVDEEKFTLEEGHCLITQPATLKMRTTIGVRILGLQIEKS
mgnify:CR=1 FL=1|jgi:quercetin dioxygenase-like cupin family protein